jgi:hypothetical protein
MKHLVPIVIILAGIALQSCIDCGPQAELTATITFSNDSLQLDSVYALKALSQEAIAGQAKSSSGNYGQLHLPISLVSDTTTYIFKSKNRTDTLSIHYDRIFRYKGGCGFITDASAPSQGSQYTTTFKDVEIIYATYVLPGQQSFLSTESATGIWIRITP